ncbi:MAG: RHS repeat-associated core domain-containing protein [Bacteroidota bacterium]
MKRTIHIQFILTILTLTLSFGSKAGILPTAGIIKTPDSGTPAVVLTTSTAMTTVMREAPSVGSHVDLFTKGIITFGVNHHYPQYFADMHIVIEVEITPYATAGGTAGSVIPLVMEIWYSPNDSLSFRDKQSVIIPNVEEYDVEIIDIEVDGVPVSTLPANLYVNAEMFVDRYYDFTTPSGTALTTLTDTEIDSDCDDSYDELLITWDAIESAEEYQLEWVYINDYNTVGTYYADTDLNYDFKRNSTRISTTSSEYKISLAYDRGFICYRVRAIGRATSDLDKRIFGVWTESDDQGTVDGVDYFHKDYAWHDTINWQFSSSYAEEGKKKEVVSFFDGSLRNRQMVTKINSDDNTIVGETIYDHQGRPAIQVLPTPVQDLDCVLGDPETSLKYYHNFTQNDDDDPYSRLDFDTSAVGYSCETETEGLGTGNGAGRYYSPSNPNQTDENAFIPDAELYPFTQVEYTPDNTGRIRRQGGVGADFQLGSGHESKYYYGHPSQIQLDRMFGSEVGDKAHYQKNMVVDPNGQVSVSYMDQEGRVIATSLAGDAPANLIALPSEASAGLELTEDLFAPDADGNSVSNQISVDGSTKSFTETMLIAGSTDVTFDYDIDMPPFTDPCVPEGLCFSCVYDLTIMVIDECGTDLVAEDPTIIPTKIGYFNTDPETGVITFDLDCENAAIFDSYDETFTINLTTGSYQIVKTLSVNEDAKQYYIEQYLDTNVNTCIQSLNDFNQLYLDNTDFSDCNPETNCDSCLADLGTLEDFVAEGGTPDDYLQRQYHCNRLCEDISECDVAKIMLMADMSPGGQYAEFVAPDGSMNPGAYPLSILNPANILPFSYGNTQIDWRDPELVLDGTNAFEYRNDDGINRSRVELVVTLNGSGSVIATVPEVQTIGTDVHLNATTGEYYAWPEDLKYVEDFRNEWQPSWANSLIVYHPEYPFYAICLGYEEPVDFGDAFTSDSFDSLLRRTDTWEAAVDRGFIESSYASIPNVNDRLTDWFSSANDVWDPFVVHSAAYYNYGVELESKFDVFTSMGANDYSMAQMAAMGVRCSGVLGAVPVVACFRFGDDAVIGDPDYNDSIRDKEWQALRAYYLSMKQSRQQQLAINLSITDPSYYGYNGCIGAEESFYPSTYDFFDNSLALASTQYGNFDQPCNYNTYPYYAYKVKRFPVPGTDINQDINNAAYQNYLLTGQCPLTGSLEHLLNEAAQLDSFTVADFLANDLGSFNGFYLALNDFYINTPVPGYAWNQVSITSSQIVIELVDTFTMVTLGTIQIDIPIGLPAFTWSDVIGFSNLQSTGGAFEFEIDALVDTTGGTMLVTLTGETSFDIDTCRFNEICTPNTLAIELSVMMDALAGAGDLDDASPVQLQGGSSPYEPLASAALQEAAYNGPTATLYWLYDSGTETFQLYESNPADILYELKIISYEPSTFNSSDIPSIGGITAIHPTQGNTCEVICEDGSGNYLGTLNCVSFRNDVTNTEKTAVPLGTCGMPESVLCNKPVYTNMMELYELLEDVIANQSIGSPGYDLFESDLFTTTLHTYFPINVTGTTSSTNTYFTITGIYYEITTIDTDVEDCPIVLTITEDPGPSGLTIADITFTSDPVLYGEPDVNGDYHQFYVLIQGYDTEENEIYDTLFVSTCIPMKICDECPDSLAVLPDEEEMEEMLMMEMEMGYRYIDPNNESYYEYSEAMNALNDSMGWESNDSLFVDTIFYSEFARNDMYRYAQTYQRFITHFDPDLDNHDYLVDPLLFGIEYGYFTNVGKEFERYELATARYNAEAIPLSLDGITVVEKPEFAHAKAADHLQDYVDHLTESIENEEDAMELEEFMESLPMMMMLEEEFCEEYYDQYVDAYLYFDSIQDSTHSCPYFDSYVPLLSYAEFQDHNLCCTELGFEIIENYNAVLLSDTLCPDPLPFLTDCEEPEFEDTTECHARWLAIQTLIEDFNESPWAIYHNMVMDNQYPHFSLFLASGKCQCARDYDAYLYEWTTLEEEEVAPIPMTLREFCDTSLVIPENPCEEAYEQYLECIGIYNDYARPGYDITSIITYESFVEYDLCNCVDEYCSLLADAVAELTSIAGIAEISLFELCNHQPPCTPDLPIQTGVQFPEGEFADPCTEILTSIAYANAYNAYQDYLDSVSQSIGSLYQAHCMNAVETFTRTYMDKEYHRTLYYYDQAGNLVKTIPPEGVELLNITADSDPLADSIRTDRQQHTHYVLTSHRMETKYEYNSLNQLTRQVNPDQDKMDIWEITLPNGLYAGMNTTAIQMVSANRGYLSGYIELAGGKKRGLLYRTDNGGTNWSKVNNTVASKLKRVEMATATDGFAIGEYGILLQTADGGTTWDMLNLYSLGVTGELNDIIFTSSTDGLVVGNSTTMVDIALSGSVATPTTATLVIPSTLSALSHTIQNIKSVTYDGSLYYFATTILDGSQSYDAILHCSSFATTTQADIIGIHNSTIHYYSSTEGIIMGTDGDIVKITTPSSGTAFVQTAHKSNIANGTARNAYFMNDQRGIVLFDTGFNTKGYYTLNGGENWLALPALDNANYLSLVNQTSSYIEVIAVGDDAVTKRVFWNTTATEPSLLVHSQLIDPQPLNLVTATMVKDANGPTLILSGTFDGMMYFSNNMPSGTETAVYFEIGHLNALDWSEYALKISVHRFATGAISGIILSSESKLYSIHRNAGSSTFVIDPVTTTGVGSPGFMDLTFDLADERIYAYDNTQDKIHKMDLSASTPVTATSVYSTAATGIIAIHAIGVSNGRITVIGNEGEITTTNSLTGGGSLSTWSHRKTLQSTPINEISYSASALMAVGENGLVMYDNSGTWEIKSRRTIEDLYAAETVGSVELVVGSNGYAQTMTTSSNGVPLMTVSGVPINTLLPNVTLRDIAADGDYTYIVGSNGTVLYSSDPATTAFNSTSGHYNHDFYGVAIPSGQSGTPKALVVGEQSVAYKFLMMNGTQQKGVFSDQLADVHFADLNAGSLVGKNFFVRQTTDGGMTWKIVRANNSVSTQLGATINKIWTVSSSYAIMGGVNYSSKIEAGLSAYTGFPTTMTDIQFSKTNPLFGCLAGNDGYLYSVTLTPSGGSYTGVGGLITGTPAGHAIKAVHIFENGNIMAVGADNFVGLWKGSWVDFSPTVTATPDPTFNDVFFHDDKVGYVVADEGIILRSLDVTITPANHTITAIDFDYENVLDNIIGNVDEADIKCIAFASRYEGIWGGNYTTNISVPDQEHTAYVRQIHDESDEFSSRFFYDRLGRIVVSQNSRQFGANEYSYSLYDALGRVYEAGVKTENTGGDPVFASVFGANVGGLDVPTVVDDTKLGIWLDNDAVTTRTEVTRSYYDESVITGLPVTFDPDPLTQRKRITHVSYEAVFDDDDQTYDHATHYDYDIHGNVKTLLQDNQKMAGLDVNIADQQFKRMDYHYDLISGNVHRVDYETGMADQWHHAYTYDADNRITEAYTTTTTPLMDPTTGDIAAHNEPGMTPYWDKQVEYDYYAHGPLSRTELGQEQVQGLDYVYTVQGWMKGVNSNTLYTDRDPGLDGEISSDNELMARDAYGYSLHYFEGDYTDIAGISAGDHPYADQVGSDLLTYSSYDLYNGNIARTVNTITNPNNRDLLPLGSVYLYDQLNRLSLSGKYNNLHAPSNTWGTGGSMIYINTFTYDANGNITGQNRTDETTTSIDELSYRYKEDALGKRLQNRLYHVNDVVGDPGFSDDIDDQYNGIGFFDPVTLTNANYEYDAEGRLIHDEQEDIDNIDWRVDGKVRKITRTASSGKNNLVFDYDAMGRRIAKHVLTDTDVLEHSTYYILDAQGNVMSIYEREVDAMEESVAYYQAEKHIYGSARLGILNSSISLLGTDNDTYDMTTTNHRIGAVNYELTNHLGNVLSVVSDKPIPHDNSGTADYWLADIRQATDYSPFGVTLSGRNFTLTGAEKGRFGFQGQENDNEIKGEGNSVNYTYRMHDPRLGRFFAVDPLTDKYPWYSPYQFSGNKVIQFVELEGLEEGVSGSNSGNAFVDATSDYFGAIWSDLTNPSPVMSSGIYYGTGDVEKGNQAMGEFFSVLGGMISPENAITTSGIYFGAGDSYKGKYYLTQGFYDMALAVIAHKVSNLPSVKVKPTNVSGWQRFISRRREARSANGVQFSETTPYGESGAINAYYKNRLVGQIKITQEKGLELDINIPEGMRGEGVGSQIFAEGVAWEGASKFTASWLKNSEYYSGSGMSDNLATYNKFVNKRGYTPEKAAWKTWSGKQAKKHGYKSVTVTPLENGGIQATFTK